MLKKIAHISYNKKCKNSYKIFPFLRNPGRAVGEVAWGTAWMFFFFLTVLDTIYQLSDEMRDEQRFMMLGLWLYALAFSCWNLLLIFFLIRSIFHHTSSLTESTEILLEDQSVGRLRLSPTRIVCCNQTNRSLSSLSTQLTIIILINRSFLCPKLHNFT